MYKNSRGQMRLITEVAIPRHGGMSMDDVIMHNLLTIDAVLKWKGIIFYISQERFCFRNENAM